MIITVDNIHAAQREGKNALTVPCNAVVTPAAQDMALTLGIGISRETPPPKGGEQAGGLPSSGSPCTAPKVDDKTVAEIRAKVLAQLPKDMQNSAVVEQLVRKHLAASGCGCDACRPVATGKPATSAPAASVSDGPGSDNWKNTAGGAIHVDNRKLPWTKFAGAASTGAVHILDAVTQADNAPFAVGYMEWENAGFPWKLDYHEVCIVLEGQLNITIQGTCLQGKPGDSLYLPKGAEVEFASPGYVKFAYVIWPADWAKK